MSFNREGQSSSPGDNGGMFRIASLGASSGGSGACSASTGSMTEAPLQQNNNEQDQSQAVNVNLAVSNDELAEILGMVSMTKQAPQETQQQQQKQTKQKVKFQQRADIIDDGGIAQKHQHSPKNETNNAGVDDSKGKEEEDVATSIALHRPKEGKEDENNNEPAKEEGGTKKESHHEGDCTTDGNETIKAGDGTSNVEVSLPDPGWQPPPDLPPTIDHEDMRYQCPPSTSSNLMTPPSNSAGQQGYSPVGSALYGYLAEGSPSSGENIQIMPDRDAAPREASIELEPLFGSTETKPLPQTKNSTIENADMAKKDSENESSDDDASLFPSEDENEDEIGADGDAQQQQQQPQRQPQEQPTTKEEESDDDASLFGSSDDDDEIVEEMAVSTDQLDPNQASLESPAAKGALLEMSAVRPTDQIMEIKQDTAVKIASQSEPNIGSAPPAAVVNAPMKQPQQLLIFDPPQPKKKTKPGGFLGGLLGKISPMAGTSGKEFSSLSCAMEVLAKKKKERHIMKEKSGDKNKTKKESQQKILQRLKAKQQMAAREKQEKELISCISPTNKSESKKKVTFHFEDSKAQKEWNKHLTAMEQYIERHGHCNVPEGHSLQKWIFCQRRMCKFWLNAILDGKIGKNLNNHLRVSRLISIGFDFGTSVNVKRVKGALDAEAKLLSPEQRMTLGEGVDDGDNAVVGKKKTKNGNKRKKDPSLEVEGNKLRAKKMVTDSSDEGDATKPRSKKRPRSLDVEEDEDDAASDLVLVSKTLSSPDKYSTNSEFVDDRPQFISWNKKGWKKKWGDPLGHMPAEEWVDLLTEFKRRSHSSPVQAQKKASLALGHNSKTAEDDGVGCVEKCWSELERSGDIKAEWRPSWIKSGAQSTRKNIKHTSAAPAANNGPPSPTRKNIKQTSAAQTSSPMKMKAWTPLIKEGNTIACTPTKAMLAAVKLKATKVTKSTEASNPSLVPLKIGKRVYSAWWKTKARSGPETYFPGVVDSSHINGEQIFYDIKFDDGDHLSGIDSSQVVPRKKYLKRNLKPRLEVGDAVYAAWWEDLRKRNSVDAQWFPGKVAGIQEGECGGRYGLFRKYHIVFDDGDELESLEDYLVMPKSDYLISTRGSRAYDEEDSDDDDSYEFPSEWIGVKNKLDKDSVDQWANDIGWFVATIDGKEQSFSLLSDALRAYDVNTVRNKGANTQKSDLNLPEEWAFPTPFGICPPVHVSGIDQEFKLKKKTKKRRHSSSDDDGEDDASFHHKSQAKTDAKDTGVPPSNKTATASEDKVPVRNGNDTKLSQAEHKADTSKSFSPGIDSQSEDDRFSACDPDSHSEDEDKPLLLGDSVPTVRGTKRRNLGLDVDKKVQSELSCHSGSTSMEYQKPSPGLNQSDEDANLSSKGVKLSLPSPAASLVVGCNGKTSPDVDVSSNDKGTSGTTSVLPSPAASLSMSSKKAHDSLEKANHLDKRDKEGIASVHKHNPTRSTCPTPEKKATAEATSHETGTITTAKEDAQEISSLAGFSRAASKALIDLTAQSLSDANKDAPTATTAKATSSRKSAAKPISHSSVSDRESRYPPEPAEGLPAGWTMRLIPRLNAKKKHSDKFFYSPIKRYKFRSKKEVERFLECLKREDGDETAAIQEFHLLSKQSKKPPPVSRDLSASRDSPSLPPPPPRVRVVEYIEPSQSFHDDEEKKKEDRDKYQQEENKVQVELKPSAAAPRHKYVKPIIKKGEQVYACWSGPEGNGTVWFPGRVWDFKEYPGGEYGPVRQYDVVFDDGDTESDVGEIWIAKKAEYEVSVRKMDEAEWIGVTNVTFPKSKDEYARTIGWYKTNFGGTHQVFNSLGDALRAHDKNIIETKGKDQVSPTDLNFPEEHKLV